MEQDRIGRLWWRIAVILWLLGLSLALALMAEQVAQQADRKLDEPPTITYTEVVEIACIHEPWTVSEEDANSWPRWHGARREDATPASRQP